MPISSTGVIITPSATSIAAAQQILINTYGVSVNLTISSPNGQWIQNVALAITQRENDQVDLVNSINPNIATGVQLDAICANLNIIRNPATYSSATIEVTGISGVVIPTATQIQSTNGDIFLTTGTITIGGGGTGAGIVVAQVAGPVPVGANTISVIITGIPGWDTVTNSDIGTLGVIGQSDAQLRMSRVNQLAFASTGSLVSLKAGCTALIPVSSYVTQNNTTSPVTIDGITIGANSVLIVLDSTASDITIATMIFQRLSAGCGMSGNTSEAIQIPNSSQSFTATWQTAAREVLGINISVRSSGFYPPPLPTTIAALITANFNFDVIGQYIDANMFTYILLQNGIPFIVDLTFNVGSTMNLRQYTMPISSDLGISLLTENVNIIYV